MTRNNFYTSDNLSFVSAAILSGDITIVGVIQHPNNPRRKIFFLSPKDRAEKLYQDFMSDKLVFSAQQLSTKVAALKNMPAKEER